MSFKYEQPLLAAITDFNRWYMRSPHTEGMNSTKGVFVNSLKRKMKEFNAEVSMNVFHDNIMTSMIIMEVNEKEGLTDLSFQIDSKKWERHYQIDFMTNFNEVLKKVNFTTLAIESRLGINDMSWEVDSIISQVKRFNFKNL